MTWIISDLEKESKPDFCKKYLACKQVNDILIALEKYEAQEEFVRLFYPLLKKLGIKYVFSHSDYYDFKDLPENTLFIYHYVDFIDEYKKVVIRTSDIDYKLLVRLVQYYNSTLLDRRFPLNSPNILIYIPEKNVFILPDITHTIALPVWGFFIKLMFKAKGMKVPSNVLLDFADMLGYSELVMKLILNYPVKVISATNMNLLLSTRFNGKVRLVSDDEVLKIRVMNVTVDKPIIFVDFGIIEYMVNDRLVDKKILEYGNLNMKPLVFNDTKLYVEGLTLYYTVGDKIIFDEARGKAYVIVGDKRIWHPNINLEYRVCLGSLRPVDLDLKAITTQEIENVISKVLATISNVDTRSAYHAEAAEDLIRELAPLILEGKYKIVESWTTE